MVLYSVFNLNENYFGFSVYCGDFFRPGIFLCFFSVSNRPQCPPPLEAQSFIIKRSSVCLLCLGVNVTNFVFFRFIETLVDWNQEVNLKSTDFLH